MKAETVDLAPGTAQGDVMFNRAIGRVDQQLDPMGIGLPHLGRFAWGMADQADRSGHRHNSSRIAPSA